MKDWLQTRLLYSGRIFSIRHGSGGVECSGQPFNFWSWTFSRTQRPMNQHHVEAAWRCTGKTHQIMTCGKNDAALLGAADAGAGTAMRRICALADFDKHQGSVRRSHDQVNLAAAASRRPIIGLDPTQARPGKPGLRRRFGGVTPGLGGNLLRRRRSTTRHVLGGQLIRLFSGKPH